MPVRTRQRARRERELKLDQLGQDMLEAIVTAVPLNDLASAAATCTALRHACAATSVLAQARLPGPPHVVPRTTLRRLSDAGNPWASYRLGIADVYQYRGARLAEGVQLLRTAAAGGSADACFELYLLSPSREDTSMLLAAAALGHPGATMENAYVHGGQAPLARAAGAGGSAGASDGGTSEDEWPEAKAAGASLQAWQHDQLFGEMLRDGLVSKCHADGHGCHRWKYRRGERRAQRRRSLLGLPEDSELFSGPPLKLKICERCRHATYCSRKCQSLDWPAHKLVCRAL